MEGETVSPSPPDSAGKSGKSKNKLSLIGVYFQCDAIIVILRVKPEGSLYLDSSAKASE